MHGVPEVWGQVWVLYELNDTRASLPWAQLWCGILWNTTPARLRTWGAGGFVAFITLWLNRDTEAQCGQWEVSQLTRHPLTFCAICRRIFYVCWDFTNSKRWGIPAIQKARVCDGIEFSLALSQYSQWRIILHGSRNRHFYVLLIFYLKLNCRYRVIKSIHAFPKNK